MIHEQKIRLTLVHSSYYQSDQFLFQIGFVKNGKVVSLLRSSGTL